MDRGPIITIFATETREIMTFSKKCLKWAKKKTFLLRFHHVDIKNPHLLGGGLFWPLFTIKLGENAIFDINQPTHWGVSHPYIVPYSLSPVFPLENRYKLASVKCVFLLYPCGCLLSWPFGPHSKLSLSLVFVLFMFCFDLLFCFDLFVCFDLFFVLMWYFVLMCCFVLMCNFILICFLYGA